MTLVWTGLAPHPPIIIAEVGGSRRAAAQATVTAMEFLAADFMAHRPERLVLISPHTPRPKKGISSWSCAQLGGDFRSFAAPNASILLPNDQETVQRIAAKMRVMELGKTPMDHGALVPLHFLYRAGWRGLTTVLSLPWDQSGERVAAILAEIVGKLSDTPTSTPRFALLASGDMSHCLQPGAPSGFDKRGQIFDQAFVEKIRAGDFLGASHLDPELCEAAHQDVLESSLITWRASDFANRNHHFWSYEGPFGVGYSVMRFAGVTP